MAREFLTEAALKGKGYQGKKAYDEKLAKGGKSSSGRKMTNRERKGKAPIEFGHPDFDPVVAAARHLEPSAHRPLGLAPALALRLRVARPLGLGAVGEVEPVERALVSSAHTTPHTTLHLNKNGGPQTERGAVDEVEPAAVPDRKRDHRRLA